MVYIPRWQIILVLVVIALGLAFASPNLFGEQTAEDLPSWLPHKQLSLGLDLQGGAHLLYEVDVDKSIDEQMDATEDAVRGVLRTARIKYKDLDHDATGVQVRPLDESFEDAMRQELRDLIAEQFVSTAFGEPTAQLVDGDDGLLRIQLSEQAIRDRYTGLVQQAIAVIGDRINELGTTEPTVQRQGADRVLVQVPGVQDPERLKDIIGKTAKMTFHLLDENADPNRPAPLGARIVPSAEASASGQPFNYVIKKAVVLSGDRLVDAQPTFQDNQPVVSFRFDTSGGKKFADVTTENVGRPFAIVLDDKVISAPVIREPILGGAGIISGSFTVQEVQDLALLLRAGALPADLVILEERTVGPSLGADSIEAGKIASMLGLVLVIIFMVVAYGIFGVMADIALAVNIILITAALSALQATLTLPGIAGIVLTIGMAVDANVLIFERIREEIRAGRTPISAVDAGYRRALTTIIDSNLTTLIAALLLFSFGSGPIRGFAVTLAIGLVSSMFTAVMVTRLMVVGWLRRKRRPEALPI